MFKRLLLLMVLVLGAGLVAAQDDAETVNVRVAHFASDAPAVDVYLNGERTLTDLAFPQVTPWLNVPAGTYTVAVTPAGAPVEEAVIGPADFDLAAGEWLTLAAIGTVGQDDLAVQVIAQDGDPAGLARLEAFHAIPALGPVDVVVNEDTLAAGLGYPGTFGDESDGFISADIAPGEVAVEIQFEGETVLAPGTLEVGADRAYFVAAIGTAESPDFVLVVTDLTNPYETTDGTAYGMGGADMAAEGESAVRVAHFSSGSPNVDVYVNGDAILSNVAFGDVSDYLTLPAGDADIAVVPAGGALADAVYSDTLTVPADSVLTLAAIGLLANDSFTVHPIVEDYSTPDAGLTRLAVFNGIVTDTSLTLFDGENALIAGLFYPQAPGGTDGYASIDLPAGEYAVSVATSDGSISVTPGTILTGAGRYYFIAAINTAENPQFVLVVSQIANVVNR